MRDANGLETMDGMKYVASCPDGEIITGMINYHDRIIVSTDKHMYELKGDRLEKIKFDPTVERGI